MPTISKGLITYLVLVAIVIVIWYLSTGFRLPGTSTITSTTVSNVVTTTSNTTSTSAIYIYPCQAFEILNSSVNTSITDECSWKGGYLGLWVAAGNTGSEQVSIVGLSDNKTYVNQTSSYSCTTFWENFSALAQDYLITLKTGPGAINLSTSCTQAVAKLNTTLVPPKTVYDFIFNGNFSNGQYTGWNVSGAGFGKMPINITQANINTTSRCYLGQPWTGYTGNFIATTYNCGTSVAPGNITSSVFLADQPFINFKIISPQDNFLYVEVLYENGTPAVTAHYNTFNISHGANASSTFRNATIPLVTAINQPVMIRVVARTLNTQTFIAVGDFTLGQKPIQSTGILYGPYNFSK